MKGFQRARQLRQDHVPIMKLRESGMPPEEYWETLLDVPAILDRFGFGPDMGDVAELGCGYGTFTVPLAARIRGTVHAIDLDPAMIARTANRARAAELSSVKAQQRDVLLDGFGVPRPRAMR
jgi:SAM-dependent methyltransferase